jgi:hypothetical protein
VIPECAGFLTNEQPNMKSLHIIPEIPLVVIWDRQRHVAETFEISLQAIYDLNRRTGDALSQVFPDGVQTKEPPKQ